LKAFVSASDLPRSPGHPFYTRLNHLLSENGFDALVERLGALYYAETMGRPGVAPGVFFRMLVVGHLEGRKSHREISWLCPVSRSFGEFLGLDSADLVPNQLCRNRTQKRLPKMVLDEVLRFILSVAAHSACSKAMRWGAIRRRSEPTPRCSQSSGSVWPRA